MQHVKTESSFDDDFSTMTTLALNELRTLSLLAYHMFTCHPLWSSISEITVTDEKL